jgi:DNA-binding transcriptional ArsR family regulator
MTDPRRRLTDAQALAALSHPARQSLLDVLAAHGPATVGTLASRTAMAAGSVSHHLGVLARFGFVEEAPELARDRREHWWRGTRGSYTWSADDFAGDVVGEAVAAAAASNNLERQVRHVRAWLHYREGRPDGGTDGDSYASDAWMQLSDEETLAVGEEIQAIFFRWARREVPDDGAVRRAIFGFAHLVPDVPRGDGRE